LLCLLLARSPPVPVPLSTRVLVIEQRVLARGSLALATDLDVAVNGEGAAAALAPRELLPQAPAATTEDLAQAVAQVEAAWPLCAEGDAARAPTLERAIAVLEHDAGALARTDEEIQQTLLHAHLCLVMSWQGQPISMFQQVSPGAREAMAKLVRAFPDLGGPFQLLPAEFSLPLTNFFQRLKSAIPTVRLSVVGGTEAELGGQPVAVFLDGHRVGTAPLELLVAAGPHLVQLRQVGASSRLLAIEAPVRIVALDELLEARLTVDSGTVSLAYASEAERARRGAADLARVLERFRVEHAVAFRLLDDAVAVSAVARGSRHTLEVTVPPDQVPLTGLQLLRTLRDAPPAVSTPTPGRVALTVEAAGEERAFTVLGRPPGDEASAPVPVPGTVYVVPGKVRLSANVTEPRTTSVELDVPPAGARVHLKPAALGRRMAGQLISGAGLGGLVVTVLVTAALGNLGASFTNLMGDTGARASAPPVVPVILLASAALIAVGLPLMLTSDARVESVTPLTPAPALRPTVGFSLVPGGGLVVGGWRF
jgi:hypothetical protein